MAIIRFATHKEATKESGWVEGSYCPLVSDYDFPMVLWEEYVGKCLSDREQNMYDDSNFYMTVWDDETNSPKEIMFATTRGWSYPSYASSPDASDDVISKYEAYRIKEIETTRKMQRKAAANDLRDLRKKVSLVAKENDIPYNKLMRLVLISNRKEVDLLGLFGGRIRSKFKLSIRQQIVNWLKDNNPKYNFPLSPRQMIYL